MYNSKLILKTYEIGEFIMFPDSQYFWVWDEKQVQGRVKLILLQALVMWVTTYKLYE